ncbi:MafI family immunity protein [Pseudorhodoferax sp.]|uniref:MafI family immunity protein n=1 Tax=Pseudorhodoferax sp. TaxID=1993553 RepID=UPI002DD6359F|nr:MafI family immunity protein [Pseudorhodoferax sp.]
MSCEVELRKLASLFEGRLSDDHLVVAIDYLDHAENTLALETLCDYLCEEDVALNESEYKELLRLGVMVGADIDAGRFRYLRGLVAAH